MLFGSGNQVQQVPVDLDRCAAQDVEGDVEAGSAGIGSSDDSFQPQQASGGHPDPVSHPERLFLEGHRRFRPLQHEPEGFHLPVGDDGRRGRGAGLSPPCGIRDEAPHAREEGQPLFPIGLRRPYENQGWEDNPVHFLAPAIFPDMLFALAGHISLIPGRLQGFTALAFGPIPYNGDEPPGRFYAYGVVSARRCRYKSFSYSPLWKHDCGA